MLPNVKCDPIIFCMENAYQRGLLQVERRNFIFLQTSMSFDHSVFSDIHSVHISYLLS